MLKFVVCLLGVFSVLCQSVGAEPKWTAKFDPPWAGLSIGMNEKFILTIKNLNTKNLDPKAIRVFSSNTDVVSIAEETIFKKIKGGALNGTFEVVPVGLGEATLFVEITRGKTTEQSPRTMKVMVRRNRLPSVASMIARYLHSADITYYFFVFLFFNFGVILSVENLKSIMIRPTGVFIAFVLIFLLVPVTTFVLEYVINSDDIEQLFDTLVHGINALSITYIANCWTVIVRGNFDLSISISAMSGFLSFVFAASVITIGEQFYGVATASDHYDELKWNVFYQFIPLVIGFLFRYFVPKARPFSSFILEYILAPFAAIRFTFRFITQDLDIFLYNLITLNSLLAGFGLTFGVNVLALLSGIAFRLKFEDCSAIAVEVVTKIVPLVDYLASGLSEKDCDLFDLLSLTTTLFMPIVLLSHLVIKIIRDRLKIRKQGIERIE